MNDLLGLFVIIIIMFAIVMPIIGLFCKIELEQFNELNDTHYTFKQWLWCSDSIKLQYAGKQTLTPKQ